MTNCERVYRMQDLNHWMLLLAILIFITTLNRGKNISTTIHVYCLIYCDCMCYIMSMLCGINASSVHYERHTHFFFFFAVKVGRHRLHVPTMQAAKVSQGLKVLRASQDIETLEVLLASQVTQGWLGWMDSMGRYPGNTNRYKTF